MDDIKKINIYELLDVDLNASAQEIKKAYRKKALKCHPDKNPDDPKAAEAFRQLSKALEVLCDSSARAAYDKLLRARKEAKDRIQNLDSKRRKYRDDLEARERAARDDQAAKERDEQKLAEEIERLRREGSKVVEEELDLLRSQLEKEILEAKLKRNEIKLPRLGCKWSKQNEHNEMSLRNMFEHCGKISCLVVAKKGRTAVIEFEKTDAALKAVKLSSDNLQIKWLQGEPTEQSFNDQHFRNFDNLSSSNNSSSVYSRHESKVFFDEEYERKVLQMLNEAYLKQINK